MSQQFLLCGLRGGVLELEGAVFLEALHALPLLREICWLELPRSHIGGQFNIESLEAELVLVALLHLFACHLLDRVLSQRSEFLLGDQVLAVRDLADAHEALARPFRRDRFRRNDVGHLEGLAGVAHLDAHVFKDRVADVVLHAELNYEGLVEEEEAGSDEKLTLGVA